jgi:hypothetical protein
MGIDITRNNSVPIIGIWSRGGGGHKAAWDAYAQRIESDGVQINGETIQGSGKSQAHDMLGDTLLNDHSSLLSIIFRIFTGQYLGDYCASQWDDAQKSGDVEKQTSIVGKQWIAEILFYYIVYFKVKNMLRNMEAPPKVVVSTQALCTSAIANAILAVNKERQCEILFHHVMTDLPTEKSTHFYHSLNSISKNEELRKIYTLFVSSATSMREADQAVLNQNCANLKVEWINHDQFPIRKAFLDTGALNRRLRHHVIDLRLKLNTTIEGATEEKQITSGLNPTASERATIEGDTAHFLIKEEDKVGFLMLGSQPSKEAVLNWIESLRKIAEQKEDDGTQQYLFVFCGSPESKKEANPVAGSENITIPNPLLREVNKYISELQEEGRLPKNFNIVPFTFQSDKELAPLMARADLTITRSGGSTCFELIHLHEAAEEGLIPKRENRVSIIHSEGMHKGDIATYKSKEAKQMLVASLIAMKKDVNQQTSTASEEEWINIHDEILEIANANGVDSAAVDSLLSTLQTNNPSTGGLSQQHQQTLHKLSNAFEAYLNNKPVIPLTLEEKEHLISARIQLYKQNPHNREASDKELRDRAIQELLIELGIPLWEGGNATYLGKVMGATVSNPEYSHDLIAAKFFNIENVHTPKVTAKRRISEELPARKKLNQKLAWDLQ